MDVDLHNFALKIICILILSFVVFSFADSSPTIKISPNVIHNELTKSLNLECTFRQGSVHNLTYLFSLLLLHATKYELSHFRPLISMSATSGVRYHGNTYNLLAYTGIINNNGVSFVNVTWAAPREDRSGLYKCEAHGIDHLARPISFSSTKSLDMIEPNIGVIVSEIKSLKEQFENILAKVNNQLTSEIPSVKQRVLNLENIEIPSVKQRVLNLENIEIPRVKQRVLNLENIKTNKENIKRAMFYSSNYYNGRRFWLTRTTSFFNPSFAQTTCGMFGGYLAELGTYDEYNFVRNFVRSYSSFSTAIMLGGTDEGHEGSWINRHSKTAVTSLWYSGQPDNYDRREHCQCLFKRFDWAMNDCPCYYNNYNEAGFVCEISE